jgi:hypothetical protein
MSFGVSVNIRIIKSQGSIPEAILIRCRRYLPTRTVMTQRYAHLLNEILRHGPDIAGDIVAEIVGVDG